MLILVLLAEVYWHISDLNPIAVTSKSSRSPLRIPLLHILRRRDRHLPDFRYKLSMAKTFWETLIDLLAYCSYSLTKSAKLDSASVNSLPTLQHGGQPWSMYSRMPSASTVTHISSIPSLVYPCKKLGWPEAYELVVAIGLQWQRQDTTDSRLSPKHLHELSVVSLEHFGNARRVSHESGRGWASERGYLTERGLSVTRDLKELSNTKSQRRLWIHSSWGEFDLPMGRMHQRACRGIP